MARVMPPPKNGSRRRGVLAPLRAPRAPKARASPEPGALKLSGGPSRHGFGSTTGPDGWNKAVLTASVTAVAEFRRMQQGLYFFMTLIRKGSFKKGGSQPTKNRSIYRLSLLEQGT